MKKLEGFANRNSIKLIKFSETEFLELIQNNNIKVTAILDKNLADAIKMNLTNI